MTYGSDERRRSPPALERMLTGLRTVAIALTVIVAIVIGLEKRPVDGVVVAVVGIALAYIVFWILGRLFHAISRLARAAARTLTGERSRRRTFESRGFGAKLPCPMELARPLKFVGGLRNLKPPGGGSPAARAIAHAALAVGTRDLLTRRLIEPGAPVFVCLGYENDCGATLPFDIREELRLRGDRCPSCGAIGRFRDTWAPHEPPSLPPWIEGATRSELKLAPKPDGLVTASVFPGKAPISRCGSSRRPVFRAVS